MTEISLSEFISGSL